MKKIKNGQVVLDEVIIPYCEEGGIQWYPIRYTVEKFLLKGNPNTLHTKKEYKPYVSKQTIDYTFKGTAPQETTCMNKDGWIKYLNECKLNKNKDTNKIKRHNIFCDYIGCKNKYEIIEESPYDDYIKDCIDNVVDNNKDINFNKCLKCNREFPLHKNFFPPDERVEIGFTGTCKMCKPSAYPIVHADTYARRVYSLYGNKAYVLYKNDISKFIEHYCTKDNFNELCLHTNTTPYIKEASKDVLLKMIKNDYLANKININDLNVDFVKTKYKIRLRNDNLSNNEINEYCSDYDCKLRPWLYPCYRLGKIDFTTGKNILNTYILDNNINVNDIFKIKYSDLLQQCKLTQFQNNILDFVVKYYDYKYAGYKFSISSVNYYKSKEARIFDMKWLIEQDLKLDISKIPLYVTKTMLHTHSDTLYNVLNKKYYEGSLFKWIDECYPNKFIELDFNINPYRSKFDSLQEAQVDEQIRQKIGNIIHNERNRPDSINIMGMMPDWLICLDNGIWLVEYWGLARKNTNDEKSTNVIYYKNKMKEKKQKYGELLKVGYKHLYIYPEDLNNNFQGLHKKLEVIA